MPFPRSIARFNKRITNPVLGRLVGRVGPFVWLEHTGRRSGKLYRTPIMAFRQGDAVLIALTYGPATDWVRNIQASGTARLVMKDGAFALSDPHLIEGDPRSLPYPPPVPLFLTLLRVRHALRMRVA
jgi:deazaflavin-dependent oxidoreductase (nitroreductase family)